jgi:hypothetical protein
MDLRDLFVIVFLLSLSSCKGQLPPKQYSDAFVVNNEVWGLTTDGKIRTFNLDDGSSLIKETDDLHSIIAFAKDNKSNIVIAIFEGGGNSYISTGLQHILMSGSIIKVNKLNSVHF